MRPATFFRVLRYFVELSSNSWFISIVWKAAKALKAE